MQETRAAAGVNFAARIVLRIGVALLGVRLTLTDIASLGVPVTVLVISAVGVSILVGSWIGQASGMERSFSYLSAGAVSICGASAALAIASVLPKTPEQEKQTGLTVVAVTCLSTVAMILYPVLLEMLNADHYTAGIFIGATIHDVAQVIGAGYIISEETGDVSAIVKLMRVICLMPLVLLISIGVGRRASMENTDAVNEKDAVDEKYERPPLVPGFILAFLGLVVLTSIGVIPETVQGALSDVSRWCLIAAVAALGVKTSLGELVRIGPMPVLVMVLQTIFLALFIAAGLLLIG